MSEIRLSVIGIGVSRACAVKQEHKMFTYFEVIKVFCIVFITSTVQKHLVKLAVAVQNFVGYVQSFTPSMFCECLVVGER